MKILITNPVLASGGAERVAVVWANSYVQLGHDVTLATNKSSEEAPYIYPVDRRVHMVKCYGFHPGKPEGTKAWLYKHANVLYRAARLIRRTVNTHVALRRVIRSWRPDIIISLQIPNNLQTLIAAKGTDIPVIATEHNAFERPIYGKLSFKESFCKFTANKWFPAVTVLTQADKDFIGKRLHNVYVMPNPLALPVAEKVPDNKQKRIVAAGRLDVYFTKGFDLLIKAWANIACKYPLWSLDIAGEAISDKSAIDKLNGLIIECGVKDSCTLSGFHSDMVNFFAESEVFVLSSRWEGFGMVLIEAMSQGCACVACDYKGRQSEIIRNENEGLCIPTDDIMSLTKAIEKMINNVDYRKKVQENSIKRARYFDPITTAHRWEKLIDKVKKSYNTPPR